MDVFIHIFFVTLILKIWILYSHNSSFDRESTCRSLTNAIRKEISGVLRKEEELGTSLFRKLTEKSECAVVGASGAMTSRPYGKEIDAHDTVIRINANPSGSHPEHGSLMETMGGKTSFRVVNSVNVLGNEEAPGAPNEPQARFIWPWDGDRVVGAWGADGTRFNSTLRQAAYCHPPQNKAPCASITQDFLDMVASLVTRALQPKGTTRLGKDLAYDQQGLVFSLSVTLVTPINFEARVGSF